MRPPQQFADRISDIQFSLLTWFAVIGSNYLVMPRAVTQAGSDGWLALLFSGLLTMLSAGSIAAMQRRFPGQTAMDYNEQLIGKIPGRMLSLWTLIHFLMVTAHGLQTLLNSIKLYLLPQTPGEVVLGSLLFVAVYAVRHGVNTLGRLAEVFFPIVVGFLTLTFLLSMVNAKWDNLLPVAGAEWRSLTVSAVMGLGSFIGYGQILFTMAFMQRPEQGPNAVVRAMGLVVALYVFTYIIAVAILGPHHLRGLLYPAVDLVRALGIPVFRIQRLEILLLVVWLLASFMSVAIGFYIVSLGSMQLLRLEKHDPLVLMLLPVLFVLTRSPATFTGQERLGKIILASYFFLAFMYAVVLPIIASYKGRRNNA